MLSDFELQGLRLEKRKQERAKSPAVEIAMRLSKAHHIEKQVREAVERYIGNCRSSEVKIEKITEDPVREVLKAGGFIAIVSSEL